MTKDVRISCNMEAGRVQELEQIVKPALDIIIQYVKEIDSGSRNIGPRFDNPAELDKKLGLQDIANLFEKSIQQDALDPTKDVLHVVETILNNSVCTWHPGFMDKLYVGTNPIGLLSDMVLSILNTNSHVFTVSPVLTVIEKKVSQKYAFMFGFDGAHAGGLTFSGGSWSNVTSLQTARSFKYPDTKTQGTSKYKFAIFTSVHSHYSIDKAAILLGLGLDSVFKVPVNEYGQMNTDVLEAKIKTSIEKGFTPLYVNATAGTTVFGSYDPFVKISEIAKKYNLWFHIDASWGGNAIFSPSRKSKLNGSHLADSITCNPHKMLGVPTTCSFLLTPDERIFKQANSLNAPYLFHNLMDTEENFDLADGTMGCGRRPDALKFYLSWLYYGQGGFQKRIDHSFDLVRYFVSQLTKTPGFTMVNDFPTPCLQVCFYYNPTNQKLTGEEMTSLTRRIAIALHKSGDFLVDYAPNPDDAIIGEDNGEFFRCVLNSPNIDSELIDKLINSIVSLGKKLENI